MIATIVPHAQGVHFLSPRNGTPSMNPPCPTCRGLKFSRMLIEETTVLIAVVCETCAGSGSEA